MMLQARWERSQKRKKLLAQTVSIEINSGRETAVAVTYKISILMRLSFHLQLGVSSVDELRQILGTDVEDTQKKRGRLSNDKSDSTVKDLKDDVAPTDEIVYKDSSTFLKVPSRTLVRSVRRYALYFVHISILRYCISEIFDVCKGNTIVESTQ